VRVDFYQLSQGSPERALALIARAAFRQGERLLVVSEDPLQLTRIGDALWSEFPDSFLAHGAADGSDAARQPILLSHEPVPANGARFMVLADGRWREGDPAFARTFMLFGAATLDAARQCWKMLGTREGTERRFWKQHDGKWVEGP
jgi:DNA polymerase-3 subunit chi